MEAYVLSAVKTDLSLTSTSMFFYLFPHVEPPLMIHRWNSLQCLKLSLRFCSRWSYHGYRTCARVGGKQAVDFVEPPALVAFRKTRGFGNSADFKSRAHSSNQGVKLRCSHGYGTRRDIIACSFTRAAAPDDLSADVEPRNGHIQRVQKFYDVNDYLFDEEDWDSDAKETSSSHDYLDTLMAIAQVERGSTVLSWGGSLAVIRQLSVTCPGSLVVSHCSLSLLAIVKELNDDTVCWHGDIVDMPSCSYGPFDYVFLNSLPASSVSPVQLLKAAAGLCKSGARIIIIDGQGMANVEKNPETVLHAFPDLASLEEITAGLPLKIIRFQDDSAYVLAALEVTEKVPQSNLNGSEGSSTSNTSEMRSSGTLTLVPNHPLRVSGRVIEGFGRGSKQMGVPTANVDPEDVPEHVLRLPKGVYCGWAQVHGEGLDGGVHKMVMNIGNRPTFADSGEISVEVHILHDYGQVDFYGNRLSFLVLGFIREEMQFKSVGELVRRIHADIETASKGLDEEDMMQFIADEIFLR